jgi:hypothetical protein
MVAIVVSASAKMPNSCWGKYDHVAVVDVPYWLAAKHALGKWRPAMISNRARGVNRILWDSGPVSCGKTERAADARAWKRAEEIALAYNSAGDLATADRSSVRGLGMATLNSAMISLAPHRSHRRRRGPDGSHESRLIWRAADRADHNAQLRVAMRTTPKPSGGPSRATSQVHGTCPTARRSASPASSAPRAVNRARLR